MAFHSFCFKIQSDMKLYLLLLLTLMPCVAKMVHASSSSDTCFSVSGSQQIGQFKIVEHNLHAPNQPIQGLEPTEKASQKAVLSIFLIPISLGLVLLGFFVPFYSLVYAWLLIGAGVLLIFTSFFIAIRVLKRDPNAKSRRLARFAKRFGLILFFGAIAALVLGLIVSAILIL